MATEIQPSDDDDPRTQLQFSLGTLLAANAVVGLFLSVPFVGELFGLALALMVGLMFVQLPLFVLLGASLGQAAAPRKHRGRSTQ